jgi:molybdenum cofactor cytidylyltransferase
MGEPKALLDYQDETFIERLVRIYGQVCDPVIVVLGHHADSIRARVEGRAEFVINEDPDRGQISSLRLALAAVPLDAKGFLFTPVDIPAVEPETVNHLIHKFRHRHHGKTLVIPQFKGKHGHPVLADRSLVDEFLALPPDGKASDVIHAHIANTEYVDVDDPGILVDVDDRETYRRLSQGKARSHDEGVQ